jgi:arginyl-tRNA synthetase
VKSVEELKKKAINGQEKFNAVRTDLQRQIIEDCNEKLISQARATSIPAEGLIPVFTEEYLEKIEKETEKSANEDIPRCFGLWHEKQYLPEKHLKNFRTAIIDNIEKTKTGMIDSVQSDLNIITVRYKRELEKNAAQKSGEYDDLSERLTSALKIQEEKDALKTDLSVITNSMKNINAITGEFEYVIN